MAQEVVVMDIGSSHIRALVVSKPNSGIFTVKHMVEVAHDGYFEGEWVDGDSTAKAIQTALYRIKDRYKFKRIYVGVPAEFCVVRHLSESVAFEKKRKVDRTDITNMFERLNPFNQELKYQLVNANPIYFELDASRRMVDPLGVPANKLTGNLSFIGCERRVIEYLDRIMNACGVVAHYTSGIYAEMMCLFEPTIRDTATVLAVDVGYLSTTVALMRGDGLYGMVSFSLGSGIFISWLQDVLGIPFEIASQLYQKVDLTYTPHEGASYTLHQLGGEDIHVGMSEVQGYITDSIEALASGVNEAIRTFPQALVNNASIYLTGGALSVRGGSDMFGKKMARHVKVVAPDMCPEYKEPSCSGYIGMAHFAFSCEDKKNPRISYK